VIDSSRIDFEEAGINASTLDDLRQVWQSRLSDMKVARFPWDPPEPEPVQPTPEPQKAHPQQQQQQQPIKQENGAPAAYQNGGVKIKTEPGMEQQYGTPIAPAQPPATLHDPQLAAMRAHQNIAQKFGPQQQLQARPQNGGGLVLPGMNPAPQQQQQRPTTAQQGGIPQHDGADDVDVDSIAIEGYGSVTREEADRILLRRIGAAERERAKATEELSEALRNLKTSSQKSGRSRRRRQKDAYEAANDSSTSYPYASSSAAENFPSLTSPATAAVPPVPRQLDGVDSDGPEDNDEVDEDAINSDLDDPEDDEIDNEDEDEIPQIMLCMYDKVQRTKNKWKCVLKDGVLTINQKEYVFHKANGEYEW
jgi:transcription initiation factor TFIIA large subunit